MADGYRWVLGVAGATRYPTDGQGTGSATNTESELVNATSVEIAGVLITTMAAVAPAVEIVDHAGNLIPGLKFDGISTTVPIGFVPMPALVGRTSASRQNVGIKLGAGVTATLFYRPA